jgi:dTDP-4-dehydrorhamnose 3,5-epimerase-like enzyme
MSDVHVKRTAGATLMPLFLVEDARGCLSGGEFPQQLPFSPARYFVVFDVPPGQVRGQHAHRQCRQFFIPLGGSIRLTVDDGSGSEDIVLDRPDIGLHVPAMIWTKLYDFSPGATLLVLASDPYDPADYITKYDEFRALVRAC